MIPLLLIATVIQILANSRSSPFILKNPAKSMKKHIADPVRRDVLVGLVKQAKEKFAKYQKRMKAYAKVLEVLAEDVTTSKEEFNAICEAMLAGLYHDQEVRILGRVKGLDFINEEEFNAIIAESISLRKLHHVENEKKWIKNFDAITKSIDQMSKVIKEVITHTERQEEALEALKIYKIAMHSMISQMATWNYRDNAILANYHSTEDELRQTTDELNQNQRRIYGALIGLFMHLCGAVDQKEWSAASKAMKSLL